LDDLTAYEDVCYMVLPYSLGSALVAVYYRNSGLIFERTCKMGEFIVVEQIEYG